VLADLVWREVGAARVAGPGDGTAVRTPVVDATGVGGDERAAHTDAVGAAEEADEDEEAEIESDDAAEHHGWVTHPWGPTAPGRWRSVLAAGAYSHVVAAAVSRFW